LDEIEPSSDFLGGVHEKIEKGKREKRIWAWLFEPLKVKVPLEATALVFLSVTAFYLYQRLPELRRQEPMPPALKKAEVAREKPRAEIVGGIAGRQGSYRVAESEPGATKKLDTQLSRRGYLGQANKSAEKLVPSGPKPEIHEVTVNEVALYERRVEDLLKKAGGSLLSQEGSSEAGLLLTVVLPQSRQAEFIAALKEEVKAESKIAELGRGTASEFKEEVQTKDAVGIAGGRLMSSEEALDRMEMATVTLQLRILPKK
jgi:hypothetical protein